MAQSSPVVFVERLTDLVGVVLLALAGVTVLGRSPALTLVFLGCVVGGIAFVRHRRACELAFDVLERTPRVGTHVDHVRRLYDNSYELLRVDVLAVTVLLSVVSWLFECLGLWLLLRGFGVELGVPAAAFVFALSSILGAVSFLPGGVGATEGSMTLLLVELGTARDVAVGATLLTRVATLWFSAALALAALPGYRAWRRHRVGSDS